MNASETVQLERLFDFLRFPSVSTDPERKGDVAACAQWLASELRVCGLTAEVHQTPGHPIVVARNQHKPGRRTVMIYGHYDVQPVDEPERAPGEAADGNKHWLTKPFEPTLKDGVIFARGATDNKGQILAHITGIGETMSAAGDLPVNLIVLVEGEEEIGSGSLEGFLAEHKDELRCDIIAVSDTGMVAAQTPTFTYGLRGIGALELRVTGPAMDLHSGIYGGAVMNPATAVARLVATLHDAHGRVAVPRFYEGVAELQDWERAAWVKLPLQEDELQRLTGVSALAGEEGFTALERIWARPTAEVNGLGGGFQGKGTKTVIPREAFAKLTFRLVPRQEPEAVLAAVSEHLRANCPKGVALEILGGHAGEPYLMNPQSTDGVAAQRALAAAFPGKEVALIREGGSIPIVNTFKKILGADTLLLGLALPDCRAHAPNENFPVENFFAGVRLNKALLEELARG
ncbi:MAG: dipeptidase [Chthoniobacteraceae bacterium]